MFPATLELLKFAFTLGELFTFLYLIDLICLLFFRKMCEEAKEMQSPAKSKCRIGKNYRNTKGRYPQNRPFNANFFGFLTV